jgi:hypothetical protein
MAGGGVVPIPLPILLLYLAPGIVIVSLISPLVRNWWGILTRIVLGGSLIFVSLMIYMHFVLEGVNHAKAYGEALAASIGSFHDRNSRWPSSLTDLPENMVPKFDPQDISPYLCHREGKYFDVIGGLFIHYGLEEDRPRLTVAHRGLCSVWNWSKSVWEEEAR